MPTPTLRAPAWMVSNDPVRPMKTVSMPGQPLAEPAGVSRSGSEVTMTDPQLPLLGLLSR